MSAERAALVAAIGANPDDDTPRLVCADWFQEQGGEANTARAEFIRTQVERARLPQTDPRQSELEARELRLLRAHGATWAGTHFAFKKSRFRRGFVEYVHLHLKHFLHHRRQLLRLEPVQDVSLTGWVRSPTHLYERVGACAEWDRVRTLRMLPQGEHHSPGNEALRVLESPHLARLRGLHLTNSTLDAESRRLFQRAPALGSVEALTLPALDHYRQVGDWFSDGVPAGAMANVRSLALPYYFDPDTLRRLAAMSFWPRLRSLSVSLTRNPAAVLELLRTALPAELRSLKLTDSGGGPAFLTGADAAFARIAETPIERFVLNGARPPAAALRPVFAESSKCRVRELRYGGGFIFEHARMLAEAPKFELLERLTLSNDTFDDRAAEVLFAPDRLRSLRHLSLYARHLTDTGLKVLTKCEHLAPRSLQLFAANVTGRALARFLDAPVCRNLVWLTFSGTAGYGAQPLKLTATLARKLVALPHLAALHLAAREIDPKCRAVIRNSDTVAWRCVRDYADGRGSLDPWDGFPATDTEPDLDA